MAASNPQELDNEIWKGIKISQMNMEEFPSALLGTIYDGFPQSYFAAIDDYIVFAASKQDIKDLVNDVETENVWGKTLSINSSLEETITEFNVGLFVNVQHTWQSLLNYAVPEVKAELQKNKELLQGFDFLALQFSHLNQTVLTNIVLTHNLSDPLIVSEETVEKQELVLEHSVLNHFYLADSKSPGKDLLFQDSLLSLQMVGSDLQQRWTFPLTDTIAGELYTIDVDKDRKWDYVFAAGNKIYALDGKGKLLQNFPFVLKDTVRIKNLSVVDYSNSKEYRIVASDKNGHVYFYDLKGENLEGWRPRKFSGAIADKVKHIRVGDKDMIIAVQENGVVNITNRRGEVYAGFPLDLKSDGIKSMVIQKGKDFEKTLIVVQDRNRRMITFNLTGAIVKEDDRKHVQLCPDSKGNSYAIVKSEEKSILIMNLNSGKTIRIPFYLGNSSIKYWNFSTRGEFFTIKEHPTGKLYIFDQQGKALKNSPLHSEGYSDIFFNEKKNRLEFYNIHKGKLQVIEL